MEYYLLMEWILYIVRNNITYLHLDGIPVKNMLYLHRYLIVIKVCFLFLYQSLTFDFIDNFDVFINIQMEKQLLMIKIREQDHIVDLLMANLLVKELNEMH